MRGDVVAGLAALAAGLSPAAVPAAETRRPNIVFILADDLGWADIGANGSRYYETPELDRLAKDGVRFTQAYAAAAVCSPTRASILTGKCPARLHLTDWIAGEPPRKGAQFRVPDWTKRLPAEEVTIADVLRAAGYATASIGKWHLGGPAEAPEKQGFDLNVAGGDIGHPASYFWPYGAPGTSHRVPVLAESGGQKGEYLTDRLTDEALAFIERNRGQPFFLYLPHYAVHVPLEARAELRRHFEGRPPANGQGNATYAAMIRSLDESVGRVRAKLQELGLEDRTIVVFMSDNGGFLGSTSNAPLRKGKGWPYEGGIREPLLVVAPGVTRPGGVCDTPVISNDFLPTLVELAGLPQAAAKTAVDGVSFAPLLRDPRATLPRDTFGWHYPHYWGGQVTPFSALRSGDWKVIHWYEGDRWELYNLAADPGERRDLAASEPERLRELRARLETWLLETGAQPPAPNEA